MIVWQLSRCEEYWMQEDHGIYATKERAMRDIPDVLHVLEQKDGLVVVSWDRTHYTKPDGTVTREEAIEHTSKVGYGFYNLTHAGYPVWGIFPTTVVE